MWNRAMRHSIQHASQAAQLICLTAITSATQFVMADDPYWALRAPDDVQREPTIGVSATHIVQTTNFTIAVYDRSGTALWSAALDQVVEPPPPGTPYFWDGVPNPFPANYFFDVRVIYDQFSNRFVVTMLHNQHRNFVVAFSRDASPDGPGFDHWDKYYLDGRINESPPGGGGIPDMDWPALGVNWNGVHLVTILRVASGAQGLSYVDQILRRPPPGDCSDGSCDFYTTTSNHARVHLPLPIDIPYENSKIHTRLPMPAHSFGATTADTAYLIQLLDPGDVKANASAEIRILAVTIDSAGAVVNEHRFFDDIPGGYPLFLVAQKCGGDMNNWKENFQNLVWQAGTLYTVRMQPREDEYGPRFVAHWYKIDVSTWPAEPFPFSPFPSILDDGVVDLGRVFASDSFGDDAACDRTSHAVFPYVMPTTTGELALFFTRMHAYGYADLCLTGRRLTDPPGVMGAPIVPLVTGSAAVSGGHQWGDYEGTARDPNSGGTIWYTGETGRCDPIVSPCTTCVSGPYCTGAGTLQGQLLYYFHTAIGSYTIPTQSMKTLTIRRGAGNQPPSIPVKIMPADVYSLIDCTLTSGAPTHIRTFGHGSNVTLRAPLISGWTFYEWIISDNGGSGPMGPGGSRHITITLDMNRTATPQYTQP